MMLNLLKKTPLHPRERLKRLSKKYLIRNQTDKKSFPQILPQKKLIQKIKTKAKILNILKKFHHILLSIYNVRKDKTGT